MEPLNTRYLRFKIQNSIKHSRKPLHAPYNTGFVIQVCEWTVFQSAGLENQRCGATVSFHNIYYKVKQGGSCFSFKKAPTKDILIDLKWVHCCF